MLAYHVEWHMRERLRPILYDDHDRAAAEAKRPSIVAPREPSPAAKRKRARHRVKDFSLNVENPSGQRDEITKQLRTQTDQFYQQATPWMRAASCCRVTKGYASNLRRRAKTPRPSRPMP